MSRRDPRTRAEGPNRGATCGLRGPDRLPLGAYGDAVPSRRPLGAVPVGDLARVMSSQRKE